MRPYLNWKTALVIIALLIVGATLYYTNQLARALSREEQKKVEQVVTAIKIINAGKVDDPSFELQVLDSNTTIPIIIAGEGDTIHNYETDFKNIDLRNVTDTMEFLRQKIAEFRKVHKPVENSFGTGKNYIYYGESYLLTQLRFFPYVLMTIILLFLVVVLVALSAAHRSIQNQVWVGLSKETAHQLGTPLSSMVGWLELLREKEENHEAVEEMTKDLDRLQLVADRFSKVGSAPILQEENLVPQLEAMVDYMQKRAPRNVIISLKSNEEDIPVNMSAPLFNWVLENLIRNALDAMPGQGAISIVAHNTPQQVLIDISDTGKGIPKGAIKKVFNPGFTTKKRGWGLGLSLAKRIIERYHHGSLYVRHSEVDKGTTFRIVLRR